jgi:meiotically up-regulated gene 157 (Mug157) protein
VPDLLALPYLCSFIPYHDPVYQNTRRFVWSESNPYFFKGTAAEGIGGPHVGIGWIWPMSLIMRGLTTSNEEEMAYCLKTLRNTDANTGFMHESFWKDDPSRFTRKWFAWANTLFGEFILTIDREHPELLKG